MLEEQDGLVIYEAIYNITQETILSLRKLLVNKKIESLQENIKTKNNKRVLEDVMGYYHVLNFQVSVLALRWSTR